MDRNPVLRATDSSPGTGLVAGGEKRAYDQIFRSSNIAGNGDFPIPPFLVRGFLTYLHMEMDSGG